MSTKRKEVYEIIVAVKRTGMKTKTFERQVCFDYNDKNFKECEGLIRDTMTDIANEYITDQFYG